MAGAHLGDDVRLPAQLQRLREQLGRIAVDADAQRPALRPWPARPAAMASSRDSAWTSRKPRCRCACG